MKRLILFAILTLTFVISANRPPTRAQAEQPKCDPAAVIKQAAALTSTGDVTKDMAALLKLQNDISATNIACNGMTFKGDRSKVFAPFDLPKGQYRMTVTTEGGFFASTKTVGGGYCTSGDLAVIGADKQVTEEDLISSDGCRIILAVTTASDPWALTIEPLQ